ncbi:LptF/LptG family permease [Gluconacetobacter azotocaptans]|uniref:LptF/LptG family permease n=1 Tax=Gluconacetobacter azotocaptans TaxID=142834 RepID=A0A7W4JVA9_9PROT|nr:LptF/LptG family permease [Gluconacetobacter azotocaptans]MBB2191553.1 LptF/LptG family permease [Gluconacetobacter azotocaptans]MBM9403260.1 LptF/LptG family permease [Gluconacetobacter azotocaptans]GBQ26469.1 transporter YjgP/YjgQ [Gluconacetobacter azotocaptans DSM 13594]
MKGAHLPIGSGRGVLLRYLSRELITRVTATSLILVALMEILALLEQLTPILDRHLGVGGILYFLALRSPLLLGSVFPLAVLIGALVMLVQMTTANEIAILRAAGLSTPALVRLLLPGILGLALVGVAIDDQVTPRAELALARWWNATDPHPETGHAFWFRSGTTLIDVGYIARGGRDAGKLDLYRRDPGGRLNRVVHLADAHFVDGTWSGGDGRQLTISQAAVAPGAFTATLADAGWPSGLRPADLVRLSMDTPPLTASTMITILRDRAPASLPPSYFRTALLQRALLPVTFIVMLLLAMPVVYIPPRTGARSSLPVWCLGGGLLFIVFQGLMRALGNAGTLPALAATLPGLAIFAFGIAALMLRIEEKS